MSLRRGAALGLLLGVLAAGPATAAETILSFHSAVTVAGDGVLTVRETIRVRAEGRQIRRGIYRDFPTRYTDRLGNRSEVGFEVLAVERDGQPEAWHQQAQGNGVRTYLGKKDRFLPSGEYTYTLTYRTAGQLGFFEDFDELYWNVTGNGWEFPIAEAACTVTLPPGVPADLLRTAGYTGPTGSTESAVEFAPNGDGTVVFRATRPLGRREGLTVAVGWPKGFVREPTTGERASRFLGANPHLGMGLTGTALLLAYYLLAWFKVGRDPAGGVVIPRFRPPGKLSPAAARFVWKMGFDHRGFAAAVLHLAVKGYLTIDQDGKRFTLNKREDASDAPLSKGERALARELFPGINTRLVLKNTNHVRVGKGLEALRGALRDEHHSVAFHANRKWLFPGVLLSLATVGLVLLRSGSLSPDAVGLSLWLAVWTGAVIFLWGRRQYFMAIAFTLAETVVLGMFIQKALPWSFLGILTTLVVANVLFAYLLKAPTLSGRRLMDAIEGFRTYLAVAETDRLRVLHPPEKTPELFERFLPYALALGVEQEWAESFSDVLESAAATSGSGAYRPGWYHGLDWGHGNFGAMTGHFSSALTSAISSSATAPGSSSGSGGGGSSGGGGGGGGGGGW